MRIFLDANILFSAAKSHGAIRELLVFVRGAGHVLCADTYVVAEARRNIEVKAAAGLPALEALLKQVEIAEFGLGELPAGVAKLLPEKDRPVLAAAIRAGCAILVTGDRTHFGPLYGRVVGGVTIHSPRSMAEALGLAVGPR